MPITVKCGECGHAMKAPDKFAGKAVKCPKCGARVQIPATVGAPPAPSAGSPATARSSGAAPKARSAPAAPSYDVNDIAALDGGQTGHLVDLGAGLPPEPKRPKIKGSAAPPGAKAANEPKQDYVSPFGANYQPKKASKSSSINLPMGLFVKLGAVAAIALIVFVVLNQLGSQTGVFFALAELRAGKLHEAKSEFEALRSDADSRAVAEAWLARIKLSLAKNSGPTLAEGRPVSSPFVNVKPGKPNYAKGSFVIPAEFTNTGQQPITLHTDDFYLRGKRDIVPAISDHKDNNAEDVTVEPGKSFKANLFFRKIPEPAVHRQTGTKIYSMIYNNGQHFLKVKVDL